MSDHVEALQERGWVRAPSRVRFPAHAWDYWQRWEGPWPHDWIELPHDMPIAMVYETIAQLPAHGPGVPA